MEHHRLKRKRGGQKGNQNARKHGFYSRALNPTEICQFWNIANTEGVDPEIAVLRVKLHSSLRLTPANPRVLREASKLLVKWYSAKFQLDRTDSNRLKKFIRSVLENHVLSLSQPDHRMETER